MTRWQQTVKKYWEREEMYQEEEEQEQYDREKKLLDDFIKKYPSFDMAAWKRIHER